MTTTWLRWLAVTAACAVTMLALDLTWLGVVARGVYDSSLASLKRPEVNAVPAALFYAMYLAVIVGWAVRWAHSRAQAAGRGAALGAVAYATYELTNWAVLRDWPAVLVPVDIAWGVALTAATALAGKTVESLRR